MAEVVLKKFKGGKKGKNHKERCRMEEVKGCFKGTLDR